MTLLEKEPQRLPEVFRLLPAGEWPSPRLVLGITGAPGSGKSALVDALVSEFRQRDSERRIGVIAVDPSSPFTGGAILGDRVRMMRHATDPHIFIRSLATRGHLGGLSLGVRGVMRVMGMIGCDVVIIETVGVGQSEVEVARVADTVLIVLAPGQGDAIQLLKAGLMEVGDVFAVNKADRAGASQLYSALLATLSLSDGERAPREKALERDSCRMTPSGNPDAFLVSATEGRGIDDVVDHLEKRSEVLLGHWLERREKRVFEEVRASILEEIRSDAATHLSHEDLESVLGGDTSLASISREVLARATGKHSTDFAQE